MKGQYHRHGLCLGTDGLRKRGQRQREGEDLANRCTGGHDVVDLAKRTIVVISIIARQGGPIGGIRCCGEGIMRLENEDGTTPAMLMHMDVRDHPDNRKEKVRYQEQQTPDCG